MKRKHIPMKVKLAAALLKTLRSDQLEYGSTKKLTADQIISLFHWDHYPIPYAEGGPDEPWNLCPMLISAHREKTRKIDVPTIAKGKRIRRKQTEHELRIINGPDGVIGFERKFTMPIDEARKLYPDILLPHPDTTAPMPREVYSGVDSRPARSRKPLQSRGFDKTKTRGFDGKVRARKKKSGTRRR